MIPFYERRENGIQIFESDHMDFPAHLHDDMEILYVLSGSIKVTIGEMIKNMTKKECAFIFPDQIHSYETEEDSLILLIIFNGPAAGSFMRTIKKHCSPEPFLSGEAVPADVHLAFKKLSMLKDNRNFSLLSAWIQIILACALPLLPLAPLKDQNNLDLTSKLVQYIMNHFTEPLTLDLLAKELHVNKYYLSHTFSGKLNMNFREYLNCIRLDYAMQMIVFDHKSLLSIWEDAGFESQRSFNRIFKAKTGMTPTEYQKNNFMPHPGKSNASAYFSGIQKVSPRIPI